MIDDEPVTVEFEKRFSHTVDFGSGGTAPRRAVVSVTGTIAGGGFDGSDAVARKDLEGIRLLRRAVC